VFVVLLQSAPDCSERQSIVRAPAQPRLSVASRAVFAPDPALITQGVESGQDGRVVQLTDVGFLPLGDTGDLYMTNVRELGFQVADQVTFDDLAVIGIKLYPEIVGANLRQNVSCLGLALRKNPGMSRPLMGSMSSVFPTLASSAAA